MGKTNFGAIFWVVIWAMMMGFMREVRAVDLFRLSTQSDQIQTLRINDSIISTLGRYRATLTQDQCRLKIQKFSPKTLNYTDKGYFKSILSNYNCSSLTIKPGQIITDFNAIYMFLSVQDFNHSTILTIDDTGVIRIIGSVQKNIASNDGQDLVSYQNNFTDFMEISNIFYIIIDD